MVCIYVAISMKYPVGKMPKSSLKECVFVKSALKIQCVKNTLQQTAFSAICPLGGINNSKD